MDEGLLSPLKKGGKEDDVRSFTWGVLAEEGKKAGYIASPMVGVALALKLMQVISIMMVGHVDELSLSSTALATSICTVTGFSVMESGSEHSDQ